MSSTRSVHRVTVTREDNLWVAVVQGLPGGATDVERIKDLDVEVRDLIAGLCDTDPDDFDIEWHYEQNGHDLTAVLERLHDQEAKADQAIQERDKVRQSAIHMMREASLSLRAIADIVGLSHQRVQQLTKDNP